MSFPEDPVQLAVIGAAHGIRGEVRVKSFTQDPLALADYGLLYDAQGRSFEVLSVRSSKNVVVVRFKGLNDRNAAEALNGKELFVSRDQLPSILEEDEFYHADLVGLEVIGTDGISYGAVSALFDFGGGDLLELRQRGQKPALIPFTKAAVPQIDIAAGRIIVDPQAAGLLTSDDDAADEAAFRASSRESDRDE